MIRATALCLLAALAGQAGAQTPAEVPAEPLQGMPADPAGWRGNAQAIPDATWSEMQGVSWHEGRGCPARTALRLLTIPYRNFDGARAGGQMIVASDVADEVLDIFAEIGAGGFVIARMELVDVFDGNDDLSMAANNTSGFNCRVTPGSTRLSQHAFGRAIDINPVQNPYLFQGQIMPPSGAAFDQPRERKATVQGIIAKDSLAVRTFAKRGWGWGGAWKNSKDYQHFSKAGN